MLFVTFPDYIGDYPKYIFKGFEKIKLNPDEIKDVIGLDYRKSLAFLAGFGLMQPGTYSTGFFATHSVVVREIAAWADANLAEAPEQ